MGQIKKVKKLKVDVCLQACKEQLSPDKYIAVRYMYVKETSNNMCNQLIYTDILCVIRMPHLLL